MTERIKLNEDERYGYFVRTRHRKKLLVVIVSLVLIVNTDSKSGIYNDHQG